MKRDLPISYNDYERICSIILSALRDLQNELSMDCMYIALVAQEILRLHHGINATICSGSAKIFLGIDNTGTGQILSFGKVDRNFLNQNEFHAWIQIDNWLVDFSAPIYKETLQVFSRQIEVPRKMMAIEIDNSGRYFKHNQLTEFVVDSNSRQQLISSYKKDLQFQYSLSECIDWYQKVPNTLSTTHRCKIPFGKSDVLDLFDLKLEGLW